MLSLSDNNQTYVVEAYNSTSRYLDALLNNNLPYFEQMVSQIYPTELQLNKARLFQELEAKKLYNRANKLYKAALLKRCYVQHFLSPYIDSEVNHK